jgi:hypothetical protein
VANYVSTYALIKDLLATLLSIEKVFREPPSNLQFELPLVVVARFGGADRVVTHDVARVDIDYYASTEDTAEAGAESIRTMMRTRTRGRIFQGAAVGRVNTISAPRLLPWEASGNVFRCGAAYEMVVHQYTGVS